MSTFHELEPGEVEMTSTSEECLRICNPGWISEGRMPSSQLFGDFPKDSGKLSCVQGSKSTAEAAYKDFTERLGLSAHSVWAVTVGEVKGLANETEGAVESRVVDDSSQPDLDNSRMAHHCYIDQRHLSKGQKRKLRNKLLEHALKRGQLHPFDFTTVGEQNVFNPGN